MLEKRLEGVKNVRRDLGMMKYICDRLLKAALRDVPPDAVLHLLRQTRDFELGIQRKSAVRKMEEVIMPLSDLWQVIQIVLESRCSLCLKTPAECRACRVRALLRRYADEPNPKIGECGYMGCTLGNSKKLSRQERL